MVRGSDSHLWKDGDALNESKTLDQLKAQYPNKMFACDPDHYTEKMICTVHGEKVTTSFHDMDKHDFSYAQRRECFTGAVRKDGRVLTEEDLPTNHNITTRFRKTEPDGKVVVQDICRMCAHCRMWG